VQSQLYALRIANSAGVVGIIRVTNCDWSGYSGSPLSVGSSAFASSGRLYITNTAGYNDQKTAINSNTIPTGATTAAAHGYYGPSRITFTGATSYTLNGVTYTATAASLWLDPYDSFNQTGSGTGTWIGY
jgi:hypothetical protein